VETDVRRKGVAEGLSISPTADRDTDDYDDVQEANAVYMVIV